MSALSARLPKGRVEAALELKRIEQAKARLGIKPKTLLELFPPNSEPQRQFIYSQADITIYGGSAGGGKTFAELLEPTQDVDNPAFGAVIFRKTMKQVKEEGGIWDQSALMYPRVGATPNLTERYWTFPSGAVVQFAGLENDASAYTYQGVQIPDIEFDELTHFTQFQFFYLLSRNRSMSGARARVRATTNPQPGWVKLLLAPWVDRKFAKPAVSGEIRYFVRKYNQIVWIDDVPKREPCTKGDGEGCYLEGCEDCFPPEKSITFIRATIYDNKDLLRANPGYVASLQALDEVEKKRLLYGDWDARPDHMVLNEFSEEKCVIPWFEIPKHWARYIFSDFGLNNHANLAVAEDPGNGRLVAYEEDWTGQTRSYSDTADKIRSMCRGTPRRGFGGNKTTEQGWRQSYRKEGIPMEEPNPKHTDPALQFQCVNDEFRGGGLVVMEGTCPLLISMIYDLLRKTDPATGLVTDEFDDKNLHLCSALRYGIVKLRPPIDATFTIKENTTVAPQPKFAPAIQSAMPTSNAQPIRPQSGNFKFSRR